MKNIIIGTSIAYTIIANKPPAEANENVKIELPTFDVSPCKPRNILSI